MNSEIYEFNQLFLQDNFEEENHIGQQKYSQVPNIFEENLFPSQDNEPSKVSNENLEMDSSDNLNGIQDYINGKILSTNEKHNAETASMELKNKIFKISRVTNFDKLSPTNFENKFNQNNKNIQGNKAQILLISKNYEKNIDSDTYLIRKKRKGPNKLYNNISSDGIIINCESQRKKFLNYHVTNDHNKNSCIDNENRKSNSQNEYFANEKVGNERGKGKDDVQNSVVNNLKIRLALKKAKKEATLLPLIKHRKNKQKSIIMKTCKNESSKTTSNWAYNRNDYLYYGINKNPKNEDKNFIIRIPMGNSN